MTMGYEGYDKHGFVYDPGSGDFDETLNQVTKDFVSGDLIISGISPDNMTANVVECLASFAHSHCYGELDDPLDDDIDFGVE